MSTTNLDILGSTPSANSYLQIYGKQNDPYSGIDPNGNLYYLDPAGNESAVAARSVRTFDAAQYADPTSDPDDTLAIQRAHDAGDAWGTHTGNYFAIYLKSKVGDWNVSAQLSLDSQYLRAIYGDGIDITNIFVSDPPPGGTPFVCTDKLFNLDSGAKDNRFKIQLHDFTINGRSDPADPIGIYRPWVTTSRWRIKVVNLENIAVFCQQIDNSEFDLELTGCGYQPLVKTNDYGVYAVTSGTPLTTLTAYKWNGTAYVTVANYFTGMVGKWLLVARGDSAVAAPDGIWALRQVSSVVGGGDDSSCVVDTPFTALPISAPGDQVPISWYRPTGSITASTSTLTITDPISLTDVGRPIWVCGAGLDGGVLLTKIAGASIDLLTLTLGDPASHTVTNAEWFVGTPLAIGQFAFDYDSGDITNDLRIRGRIEGHHGPAMILHNCENVRFSNLKTHGMEQDQNNIGFSAHASVQSRCTVNTFDSTCLHENIRTNGRPIGDAANGGCHLVLGTDGVLTFHGQYAPMPDYAFLVDCRLTASNTEIHLGGGGGKPANQPWVKRASGLTLSAIKFDSAIIASGFDATYRTFAGPAPITVTVANGSAFKILDPDMAVGYLFFTCTTLVSTIPVYWARGMFICGTVHKIADVSAGTNTNVITVTHASTAVTTGDGAPGEFNILSCNDGKIALLNLTGDSLVIHIARQAYG